MRPGPGPGPSPIALPLPPLPSSPPVPSPILSLPEPDPSSLLGRFALTPPRTMPCPRPALEGAPRGGEGQVQGGIDAAPRQWPRGHSRLGSRLGTVPACSANDYRRARTGPSTAPSHARAATHTRRAIRRADRATRRTTPAARRSCSNVRRTNWLGRRARRASSAFDGTHCFGEQLA